MLRHERVLGVVSSSDLRWKESTGFSLAITDSRIAGALRPDYDEDFWAYFPPGKERDVALAEEADRKAGEIIARKVFELQREDVVKIIYDPPGLLFGGRLLLVATGRKVELKITVLSGWNLGVLRTIQTLVYSLSWFDPQLTFDERTGGKVGDEMTKLLPR
jgi:hypothetical protein